MRELWKAALVAGLWLVAALVSRSMAHAATQAPLVWLSSGVAFAALGVSARWAWPPLLAGSAAAAVAWGMEVHHLGVGPALLFGGIEAVSVGLGAWIATLGRRDPHGPRGVAPLISGAVTTSLVGASLATAMWSWLRPGSDLAFEWRAWALSSVVGILLVAPLVTAFSTFRVRRSGGLPMRPFLGGAAAFLAFIAAVLIVFSPDAARRWGGVAATLAYVPMPFLLIASLLWGPRGGTLATLVGALLIIERTAQGGGPFTVQEGVPGESVVEVQGFVMTWAVVLLLTRALGEGLRTAWRHAREWQLRYERTLGAIGVASVEYDPVSGRATWGPDAARALGTDATDAATLEAWLDRIDPADRGLVQASWHAVATGQRATSDQAYTLRLSGGRDLLVRERLAAVTGGDGRVEQVVALLTRVIAEPVHA